MDKFAEPPLNNRRPDSASPRRIMPDEDGVIKGAQEFPCDDPVDETTQLKAAIESPEIYGAEEFPGRDISNKEQTMADPKPVHCADLPPAIQLVRADGDSLESSRTDRVASIPASLHLSVLATPAESLKSFKSDEIIYRPVTYSNRRPLWLPRDPVKFALDQSDRFLGLIASRSKTRKTLRESRIRVPKANPANSMFYFLPRPLESVAATESLIRQDQREIVRTVRDARASVNQITFDKKQAEKLRKKFEAKTTTDRRNLEKKTRSEELEKTLTEMRARLKGGQDVVEGADLLAHQTVQSFFKGPTDRLSFFLASECVCSMDRAFRLRAKELGLPLIEADDIRREFLLIDEDKDGKVNMKEFSRLAAFVKYGRGKVLPDWEVSSLWSSMSKDADGCISLDHFITWAAREVE